jgi:hypothetical protein
MKRVYLAARYDRREEMVEYARIINQIDNYVVAAKWLSGAHQVAPNGLCLGDDGVALVECKDIGIASEENAALREKFALDDWNDVIMCDIMMNFTEPPDSTSTRGGRHVEFGMALVLNKRPIVVGYKENIFHWLPQIEFYPTWQEAIKAL